MSETIKTNNSSESTEWDILSHNYPEEAAMHAKTLSEIQLQFTNRIDNLRNSNTNMSEEEFAKWEDEYLGEATKMKVEIDEGNMNLSNAASNIHFMVAFPGAGQEKNLNKTIEAQAGNYFFERSRKLRQEIEASDLNDEEKEKEKNLIEKFVGNAYEHIYLKYMDRDSVRSYGFDRYERNRTDIHNKTIKSLNEINELAKKYKLKPFTPRNFWPSDIVPKNRQSAELAKILRYDRDLVEEYYEIAFPKATEEAKTELERNSLYL